MITPRRTVETIQNGRQQLQLKFFVKCSKHDIRYLLFREIIFQDILIPADPDRFTNRLFRPAVSIVHGNKPEINTGFLTDVDGSTPAP